MFSRRGLRSHVRQSKDLLCRMHAGDSPRKTGRRAAIPPLSSAHLDQVETQPPNPFLGDLFGTAADYLGETFGQEDIAVAPGVTAAAPGTSSRDLSDDDSDDMEELIEGEQGYEVPRDGAPTNEILEDNPPSDHTSSESEDDAPIIESEDELPGLGVSQAADSHAPEANIRREAEAGASDAGSGAKPVKVVSFHDQYPLYAAGLPVAQHTSPDACYLHAIHGKSNPWAPFKSQNDWEVARWAKLRGKGSNAFNDLLAIPGVRPLRLTCTIYY